MKRTRSPRMVEQEGSSSSPSSSSSFQHQDDPIQTTGQQICLAQSPQAQAQPQTRRVRRGPNWRDGLAGAIAGAGSKTAMAPIERIKLLLQLQGSATLPKHRLSAWEAASKIYQEEGLISFWRGNLPNVMRTAGQAALNLALMDYYKSIATYYANFDQSHPSFLQPTNDEIYWQRRRKLVISFVSGGLAGGSATTLLYPTEFLRTRLAMDLGRSNKTNGNGSVSSTRQYKGMGDVIAKTLQTDGMRGLYQGYGIALWGSVLYRLLFLGGYDAIKYEIEYYKQGQQQQRLLEMEAVGSRAAMSTSAATTSMSMGERFMLAQSVAITAGTICYPIDSVRRRLMMQAGVPKAERKYNSSLHCFKVVFKQEGVGGFYLGIGPNLVRSIGGALMLVAYDVIKNNI
ncbi:unnamed protein product [Cylindrotheca closterium]|uniref:ADP/ATP translocase n=1 Tax=Cylindrotheca closterium TaxID=2856 RepID=A0AAD2CG26_9STRA|nr:unnamed protein product [Cylindrotheca closterium]